ncbi:PEP-CTERM sorting domain-containing protein [Mucisphaera sp.]|uniref:PEP-CTERM sorting domain-containing protein n=1 Tax=Mucisphaera sp. TaxID=2913024 RepID=UPI003D131206
MYKSALTLCAVAALATQASAIELTSNGGFETGDTSDWVSFPTANSTFNITTDANSGAWAAEVFNNDLASSAVIKQANLGIGTVQPGDLIDISFAAKGEGVIGGVVFAEFFSELDGGGTSSAEILGGGPLPLTSDYQVFNFQTTAGADVSGGVTLQFATVTGGATGSVSILFIDDASVSIVPEPASLGLLGAGALALVRRRRMA